MIDAASQELRERIGSLLNRERLIPDRKVAEVSARVGRTEILQSFDTPRRLAVLASDIDYAQPDVTEQITGPSVAHAYKDGQPTQAAISFAKKVGIEVAQLEKTTTAKGEYLSAKVTKKGRSAAEILAENLPKEISSIYWPKNMYWRKTGERFVRPVRWLVAMLDEETIPLEFDGVLAGKISRGHRILSDGSVTIPRAGSSYVERVARGQGFGTRRARAADSQSVGRGHTHDSGGTLAGR